jgi:Flp pilus assembly pilin Flp
MERGLRVGWKECAVIEFVITQESAIRARLLAWLDREDGQDMIEYALLAALISIVAIVMILAIGPYIQNTFEDVVNALAST